MAPEKQSKLTKFFCAWEDKLAKETTESAPKRRKIDEDTYKEARLEEALPYVPNGSRDKFGNARKRCGGRPRKATKDLAGVRGGASSNVKRIGDERRRELSTPDALQLIVAVEISYFERFPPDQGIPTRVAVNKFYKGMTAARPKLQFKFNAGKTIERICLKKPVYELRASSLHLGVGRQGRTKGKRGLQFRVGTLRHSAANRGCRAPGAGRKNLFDEFLQLVKIYTDCERLRGHHLEAEDCVREFLDQLEKRMQLYTFKRKYDELTPEESYKYSLLEERYERLTAGTRYKDTYTKRILVFCKLAQYYIGTGPSQLVRAHFLILGPKTLNWLISGHLAQVDHLREMPRNQPPQHLHEVADFRASRASAFLVRHCAHR